MKKYKETKPEVCVEVWCLKYKVHGHDKDHCPVYANYITRGGEIPLNPEAPVGSSVGNALWCVICQVVGQHVMDNFHLLQKFFQRPQQLFCNFYKSVGHDECNCQRYELIMERTPT